MTGQEVFCQSNLVRKWVILNEKVLKIDNNAIVPNTLFIKGYQAPNDYTVDEFKSTLYWKNIFVPDSVFVEYRRFQYDFTTKKYKYDYDSIRFNFLKEQPFKVKTSQAQEEKVIDFGSLKTEGSIGRAIAFGNSQDAVVNSTMNLQISGFIGDSLELIAAVSDSRIPILPDGNTQDLREFDRIFMQVKKKDWQLSLGDIDLRQNKNYFLKFYKRLQGVSFETKNQITKNIRNSALISGAIAKGKFTRNILIPLEGNQGPYRLVGANNELFFVVLPNTERVFVDGVLLQRGEDQDYVINYNTAEVTFTQSMLITKDLRIQIEFEYADRNFLNSQLYFSDEININKKTNIFLGAYSNKDARNSSIDQVLSNEQKQFLSTVGDSIRQAFFANVIPDTLSAGKLLYKKYDTLVNGFIYPIYIQSNNTSLPLFSVSFSFLGKGKGNYRQLLNATNGRVFEWVQPSLSGVPQGDWEPVILLATPKLLQVYTVGADHKFTDKIKLTAEFGLSNYDLNLFSAKDKGNDKALAGKFAIEDNGRPVNIFNRQLQLSNVLGYEFVSQRFRPLERLRAVEFFRDWGLELNTAAADEKIINHGIRIFDSSKNFLQIALSNYNRSDSYNGTKQSMTAFNSIKGFEVSTASSFTQFNTSSFKGQFIRPNLTLKKTLSRLKNLEFALNYSSEENTTRFNANDSLSPFSFGFVTYQASLKTDAKKSNKYGVNFFQRKNSFPFLNKLTASDVGNNYNIFTDLLKNEKHQLKFNATYRTLELLNDLNRNIKSDQSLIGRAEYNVTELKGFITGNALYEIGSGQEQRREFSYVQVPAGQGQYTWIDYNGNGVPELNEFEEAVFQDQKRYLRVYTPSQQFVKANYLQFNYSVTLDPRSLYAKKPTQGINKIFYNLSLNASLQKSKKTIADNNFLFNPFSKILSDTALLSLSSFVSNTIFYNRTSTKWGMDFTQANNSNKSLLSFGFENRRLARYSSKLRINLSKQLVTNVKLLYGENQLGTVGVKFSNRNYDVAQKEIEPDLTFLYKSKFRATVSYRFADKRNIIDSLESLTSHTLNTELKYNMVSDGSILARLTYSRINFNAYPNAENTTVGYLLLNGLLPGNNILWNAEFTKRLGGALEMRIEYEGRKPASSNVVHTGRASIRAIF